MKAILRQSKLVKHSQRYFTIGLIGTCEDRNSSYLQGPALAPDLIQRTLRCDSSNNYSELGLDVLSKVCNYENIHPPTSNSLETAVLLEQPFRRMRAAGQTPLVLGGDHSITFPVIKALHAVYASSSSHQREAQQDQQDTAHPPTPPAPAQQVGSAQAPADSPLDDLVIVHFDAHPDIYPNFENNLSSHASPFARILEAKLACRLISVGIRTANPVQREQLVKFPITWVEAKHFPVKGGELRGVLEEHIGKETKVYLSIDLDVLEPGLAPGVSHREAGGLTVRQLIDAIHCIPGQIIGADVVEYNPLQDQGELTAFVAAKVVKEVAARILAPELAASY